jgi:hypothetical protein
LPWLFFAALSRHNASLRSHDKFSALLPAQWRGSSSRKLRPPLQGQRSRRRLNSAADEILELSWSRVAVDRVALQVGETWAEVRLTPRPARNLCLVPLGHRDVGCQ